MLKIVVGRALISVRAAGVMRVYERVSGYVPAEITRRAVPLVPVGVARRQERLKDGLQHARVNRGIQGPYMRPIEPQIFHVDEAASTVGALVFHSDVADFQLPKVGGETGYANTHAAAR